jgi:hypothetical protein
LEAKTIDSMSLVDARLEAQKIVLGPLLFQARCARRAPA